MNEIITPFTYSGLPVPVATEIEAATTRIKDRLTRQVKDIIEIGRDLLEVKSKLEHGQFEAWLNTAFNMTIRTAQKCMRAAKWMADKSGLGSHLTPNTIYLLSAPSTPETVQQQILGDLEAGKPVNHREVREVVQEAKYQEREAKKWKGETRAERKERKAREEHLRRKHERIEAAAMAVAREVADILVNKLSDEEITKVEEALMDLNVDFVRLRGAIIDARQLHSDNVTVFPPKPWESKT